MLLLPVSGARPPSFSTTGSVPVETLLVTSNNGSHAQEENLLQETKVGTKKVEKRICKLCWTLLQKTPTGKDQIQGS
nr:ORF2 [Anelloviridae sp.]